MNKKIIKYPICESTNKTIKKIKKKEIIIMSDFQYNGKGKLNNAWKSEPYKNLTFSILLKPNFTIKKVFNINAIILISIKKTLSKYINGKKIKIKWPNDVYYNKKKIAGILIENIIKKKKKKK